MGKSTIGPDFARWFSYGVLATLIPPGLRFLYLRTQVPLTAHIWPTIQATLGNGELFLVSCCIACTALGERAGRRPVWPQVEIFISMACQLAVVASAFFYALTFAKRLNSTGVVATASCLVFILAVLASASLTLVTLYGRPKR